MTVNTTSPFWLFILAQCPIVDAVCDKDGMYLVLLVFGPDEKAKASFGRTAGCRLEGGLSCRHARLLHCAERSGVC